MSSSRPPPEYSGVRAYRGSGRPRQTSRLARRRPIRSGWATASISWRSRFAAAACSITSASCRPKTRPIDSWSAVGDRDELAASFAGWDPRVTDLLEKVETCFWWGLYDRRPLASWTKGRLALLGDAAHPMLPHLGQGANQAIEDGVALAVLLEQVRVSAEVTDILRANMRSCVVSAPTSFKPRRGKTACATIPNMKASNSATAKSPIRRRFANPCTTMMSRRPPSPV